MIRKTHITVDGLAFSGKTTLARLLARCLSLCSVSSGDAYRAIAAFILSEYATADISGPKIETTIARIHLELCLVSTAEREYTFALNGNIYSAEELRSQAVDFVAAAIAQRDSVRKLVSESIRRFSQTNGVVLDGRDAGSQILPRADLKLVAEAPLSVRIARRGSRLGQQSTTQDVYAAIVARDILDLPRMSELYRKPEEYVLVSTCDPYSDGDIAVLAKRALAQSSLHST